MFLPTDIRTDGGVNYTGETIWPFHHKVDIKRIKPGTMVTSPVGPAIGCSHDNRCDITWEVDVGNISCPCAFNISCCDDGVTLSFWWKWDLLNVPYYRTFMHFGGIYVFYNPSASVEALAYRIYESRQSSWYSTLPPTYGTWLHVVLMVKSNLLTVFLNGRYHGDRGIIPKQENWFPGSTILMPRFRLKSTTGNYSIGKLHLWKNKQTALFLWRQHYEDIDANSLK